MLNIARGQRVSDDLEGTAGSPKHLVNVRQFRRERPPACGRRVRPSAGWAKVCSTWLRAKAPRLSRPLARLTVPLQGEQVRGKSEVARQATSQKRAHRCQVNGWDREGDYCGKRKTPSMTTEHMGNLR